MLRWLHLSEKKGKDVGKKETGGAAADSAEEIETNSGMRTNKKVKRETENI